MAHQMSQFWSDLTEDQKAWLASLKDSPKATSVSRYSSESSLKSSLGEAGYSTGVAISLPKQGHVQPSQP